MAAPRGRFRLGVLAGCRAGRRAAAPAAWAFLVWILLTWKFTAEQLLIGVAASTAAGLLVAPLGKAAGPWALLRPRRLRAAGELLVHTAWWIVVANVRLARRIWAPSRPLRSGMVVVPTRERGDAGVTTVALLTSVIVDNQLVDLDTRRGLLQYHAVAVPDRPETINEHVERILRRARGAGDGTDERPGTPSGSRAGR
ncbi:Na+/H+ antiporter subunit E [Actinomadura logoneensis]|uniref:Na+/H+ antiporter subunit E n=1 Tax=Actinomadura logoneensis TaxID=2293572 RepID=UPI0018F2093A|nr:Na+/H+ antiporter subunit E [Actinomadura logoneensis]